MGIITPACLRRQKDLFPLHTHFGNRGLLLSLRGTDSLVVMECQQRARQVIRSLALWYFSHLGIMRMHLISFKCLCAFFLCGELSERVRTSNWFD